ncbi:phage tail tip lysozyme [Komagataeibacter xylinus]|uniref:phage tail tip lysozyme n=1 Tax=Komagataeibacter xylinus TaxID=28448 RepID=UPI001031938D|nr:phage tail tip lysozyme [Komagataeibacter xylinus]
MSDDFLFGLKFNFDPTDFLRGSAEAQDELERMVAGMAHARRRSEENVEGLARSLSLSTTEVRAALKEIEHAERDHARESARINRDAERDRAQQEQIAARRRVERERAEMTSIRERTQAVAQLRDTLLSVAAITLGEKGVAGLNNLLQETSARGVDEQNFAQRTNTSIRANVAEEEGAYLSGRSSREEARQSIGAYSNAQVEYRRTGQSELTNALLRSGVQLSPEQLRMNHAAFVQYVVGQLRGLGYDDQVSASILDQSGLTSGGYTNLALHPDEMRRFNAEGDRRAQSIAGNTDRDLEFQRSWRNLMEDVGTFRTDIAHDLEPWVDQLDGWVKKWDQFCKDHPDKVSEITTATAVAVALGGLFSAIAPIVGTLIGMRGLLKGAGLLKDGATLIGRGGAATVRGGAAVIADNPIVAAATVAGAAGYAAYKEISYDRSDAGRIANNLKAMRDPHYGANRYSALEKNQREYELTQYLMKSRGYTPEQAAAVAAMARSEGGFNTEAIGDSGYAEGMFQWHAPRRKAIEAHFGMRLSRMTMEQQADALDWEMHNVDGVKSAGRRLFGSGHDLHAAVRGALDAELPKEYIKNGVRGREYADRFAMSAAALRRISTPTPQVASGNTTQIHMQNVTVKANNPQQLVDQTRKMALTPHDYASSANSGQF